MDDFEKKTLIGNKNKKTIWVLSIDGGGIRGLFSSILITKIEKLLGISSNKFYDLIVGVSVGGIIALSIGQEEKYKKNLVSLFNKNNVKQIFDKSYWDRILPVQTQPKYDGVGKKKVIDNHTFIKKFGDVSTNISVLAYDIKKEDPRVFRSWEENDKDLDPAQIADATSAAPTYFPCTQVNSNWYCDGGIFANNPCLIALQDAQKIWGKDADIRIISIGTGHDKRSGLDGNEVKNWGAPRWIYNGLIDILMDAPIDTMCNYCKFALPKGNFIRINGVIPKVELDDTSDKYRKILEDCANRVFENKKDEILNFFKGINKTSNIFNDEK